MKREILRPPRGFRMTVADTRPDIYGTFEFEIRDRAGMAIFYAALEIEHKL